MECGVNLSQMCRVCATKGSDFCSIFHTNHGDKTVAEILSIFLQKRVHEDDGRPANICFVCIPNVLQSFDLITMVQNSELFFQRTTSVATNNQLNPDSSSCAEPFIVLVKTELESTVGDPLAVVKQEQMDTKPFIVQIENNQEIRNSEIQKRKLPLSRKRKQQKHHECEVCGELFRTKRTLDEHLCEGQEIACGYCLKIFRTTNDILRHLPAHKDDIDLVQCDRCNESFGMETLYIWHEMKHERTHFACDICNKKFNCRNTRSNHVRIVHSEERPHVCSICEKGFKERSSLDKHIRLHTGEMPYACTECPARFRWKGSFDSHLKSHSKDPSTSRDNQGSDEEMISPEVICRVEMGPSIVRATGITDGETINKNTRSDATNKKRPSAIGRSKCASKSFECYMCYRKYESLSKVKQHLRTHDSVKPIKCNVCGESFSSDSEHVQHLCKGSEIACEYCPMIFRTTIEMFHHLDAHKDDFLFYNCTRCATAFNMKTLREWHEIQHDRFIFHCEQCDKRYATKQCLVKHVRYTHNEERPYLCAECGAGFKEKTALKNHSVIHTDEMPFACPDCPKKFRRLGALKTHKETHRIEKYVCQQCGAIRNSKTSLRSHEKHHKERTRECEICGMKFHTNDSLRIHFRIHTGEKPHICSFCSAAYTQKNDLVKHLRKHVGDKTYKCDHCNTPFRYYAELRKHSLICTENASTDHQNNDYENIPSTSKPIQE